MIRILGVGLLAFLIYIAQRYLYRRFWQQGLHVELLFSSSAVVEGEGGELLEVIENRKLLPLPMLKVKFQTDRNLAFQGDKDTSVATDQYYRNDVFQIKGKEKITRILPFTGKKRGYYKIKEIDLVASDLFLTTEMIASMETDRYLYVYPRPYEDQSFQNSLRQLQGEILAKRHLIEDPFEFRGIREYQPTDDMRSVNWKATAKTGELKVNLKNYTALKTIRIFLNLEDYGILKKDDSIEMAIRLAAALSECFLSTGMQVACYGNGKDKISGDRMELTASAGAGQLENIYRALARIDTNQEVYPFAATFRERLMTEAKGAMTVLIAPNAYDDTVRLFTDFTESGGDFLWFYPTLDKKEPDIAPQLHKYLKVIHHH
jgi:uncharacterized protein (DUF58 family)